MPEEADALEPDYQDAWDAERRALRVRSPEPRAVVRARQSRAAAAASPAADAARKALEKRTSQIIVRFLTEFLGVALSETIAYLIVPFFVMNTQLLIVNILRRGESLAVPGLPPSIALPALELWEIAVILFIDFVMVMLVLSIVAVFLAILVKIEEVCSVPIISTICDII